MIPFPSPPLAPNTVFTTRECRESDAVEVVGLLGTVGVGELARDERAESITRCAVRIARMRRT